VQRRYGTGEILYGANSCTWWTKGRDNLAFVSPVEAEIILVHRDHNVTGIEFTHANQASVGKIGLTILVAAAKIAQLLQVTGTIKSYSKHFILHQ